MNRINKKESSIFVPDTRQSSYTFLLQVSSSNNNTYDKGVVFSKENICKGNFMKVVADATPFFNYFLNMRQSSTNKTGTNNSNSILTSANETGKISADLQAQFHYTVQPQPQAIKKPDDKLRAQIKQFFEVQSASEVQEDLHDLYQIFMRSPEFADSDVNHRSNLFFMINQVTSFIHGLEKSI